MSHFLTVAVLLLTILAAPVRADTSAANVPQYLQQRPTSRLDQPTQWTTCAWDLEKRDTLAECATVIVPMDYAAPTRGDFRLFVKRRKVIGTPSAQVWILHGGPGASATEDLKRLSFDIAELRPDVAYYAVDHRGVGGSEKLECPGLEPTANMFAKVRTEQWPGCIAHLKATVGSRLNAFTTTNSARDIGALAEKYRVNAVPVFIYGASYGTYLAQRYMHLFPQQPAGVILEGLVDPNNHSTDYDRYLIRAADDLLEACGRAPACASHFDGAPAAAIRRALNSLDQGHCAALKLTTEDVKATLGAMTFYANTRVFVPALARRIGRCAPHDVAIIERVMTASRRISSAFSRVLNYHVGLSEEYTPGASTLALQKQFDEAALATGAELAYSKVASMWPRYPRDEWVGRKGTYEGPLLMLQGGLDTPTSLARAQSVREQFRGPKQYWVEFPEGAHGITSKTATFDGSDCARSVYLQFVNRPDVAPDTRCIERILPINWNSNPDDAMRFMGTLDIWDGA